MLGINDLGDVLNEVEALTAKWRVLCIKLHIRPSRLDLIKQNYPTNCETCLCKGLEEWLKLNYDHRRHGRPSWRRLAEAVWGLDRAVFERIATAHMQR